MNKKYFGAEDFGYVAWYDGLETRSKVMANLANAKVAPLLQALEVAREALDKIAGNVPFSGTFDEERFKSNFIGAREALARVGEILGEGK